MLRNTYFKTRLIGVLIVIILLQVNSFGQNNTDSIDEAVKQTVEDYLFLSKSYYTRSSIKALEFSQKALEIALELQRDTLLAKAYKGVGVATYYARNNENAIVYYDSALIYFDRTGNELEAGNVYNNLGICYNILGNRLIAIDCYIEALKIKTKLNDIASVGHISNNLGTLYYELFAFDEALKYYKEANRIAKSQNDLLGTHTATNNIGLIQQYTKDYELAKSSFFECLHLATELKEESLYSIDCLNIGNIYISQNNADSAYFYFIKARDFFERVERPTAKIWLGIGRYYKLKNQNTKAIESFQKALIELTYQNDVLLKIDLLHEMYLAYEKTGNIPVAYSILKQFHAVFDSVKALFDSTALTNQRSNFELENKKREIQILQQESNNQAQQLIAYEATQKQRNVLFVICAVSFMIFIILILIYNNRFKKLKVLKDQLFDENKLLQTKQKELEESYQSLKIDEEMLRWLMNASPDFISIKDGNGRLLEANASLVNLFGLNPNEYKHKTDEQIAELNQENKDELKSAIVSDELCWQKRKMSRGEEEYKNKKGEINVFDVIKIPHYNEDGSRKLLITIGRDISQLKQSTVELDNSARKADESERIKTVFFSNMSHEIRTPLNSIIGFSDLLDEPKLSQENRDIYIKRIQVNANALQILVDDFNFFSHINAGEIKSHKNPLHFNILFSELLSSFRNIASARQKSHLLIQATLPAKEVILLEDEQLIRQILTALFYNSLKNTDQGKIEFGFHLIDENTDNQIVRIFLKDTGSELSVEKQKQLISNQTAQSQNNLKMYTEISLGLINVNHLVRIMDGHLTVQSSEKNGTEIIIDLPAETTWSIQDEIDANHADRFDLSSETILIVEDVDSSFELLSIILKAKGAQILHAKNGNQAIEMVNENRKITLVLMDIQLPGINGYEATKQIKMIRPGLPVIAQTAFAMADEKEACFDSGCEGYIAKPIQSNLILPVLYQVLYSSFTRPE